MSEARALRKRPTSSAWNDFRVRRIAEVREKCLLRLKYGFFLQKLMDSLQEAFIHAPELCEARFIMDALALFDVFWTVEQKNPLTAMITLRKARTIFNITPIGFVWKKKVIYT